MRRVVILVLLGIIFISTLSSLLSNYVPQDTDRVVLNNLVAGVVGAGNFSYWNLGYTGPLLIELISHSGDADLYVSDSLNPSFEVDRNNFSSTTCGIDLVKVPMDFPRPVGIGVFGHWSHAVSEYSIQVSLDTSAIFSEEQLLALERAQQGSSERSDPESGKRPIDKEQHDEETRPRFLKLLDILDMVFELFVL